MRTNRKQSTKIYHEMQSLIAGIVWDYHHRYNWEWDELMAEANLLFMIALKKYDKRAKLSTWLTTFISKSLINYIVRTIKQAKIPERDFIESIYPSNIMTDLMDGLDNDAKMILDLVFDIPSQIQESILTKGTSSRHFKAGIKRHLTSLGWSRRQIQKSFNKISNAIN